jgi:hypothetical protein
MDKMLVLMRPGKTHTILIKLKSLKTNFEEKRKIPSSFYPHVTCLFCLVIRPPGAIWRQYYIRSFFFLSSFLTFGEEYKLYNGFEIHWTEMERTRQKNLLHVQVRGELRGEIPLRFMRNRRRVSTQWRNCDFFLSSSGVIRGAKLPVFQVVNSKRKFLLKKFKFFF